MVERVRRYGIVHWYIVNITITMQSKSFCYFAHDSGRRQSHHLHLHAAGKADPSEAMPYPLVIQDHDLRTLLEIKLPEPTLPPPRPQQQTAKHAQHVTSSIAVPTTRVLPQDEQPDIVLRDKDSSDVPVVQRSVGNTPPGQAAEPMSVGLPVDEEMKKDPPYLR